MVVANSEKSIYMFFVHDYGCPNTHSLYAVDIPNPLLPPPQSESDPSYPLDQRTLFPPLVEFPRTKYPYGMCAVEFDSKIHFLGGLFDHYENFCEARYSRDVYTFDPTTCLLEVAPKLNAGKFCPLAFVADSKIFVLSGSVLWSDTNDKKLSRFEVFENGKWLPLPVDPPFHNTMFNGHALVNRKVFISTAAEGLFCFDLDSFGWTKIISDGCNPFSSCSLWRKMSEEEESRRGIFEDVVPPFEGSAEFVEDTLYACSDTPFGPCSFGPSSVCNNGQEEELFGNLAFLSPGVVEAHTCLADPSSSLTHMGQRRFCYLIVGNPPHPLDPEATDPSKFYVDLTMFEASKETYYSEQERCAFFMGKFLHSALFVIESGTSFNAICSAFTLPSVHQNVQG